MIGFNKNVYLETSAVNFLADQYMPYDAKATKIYHSARGSRFYVSPITIWEILLTSDDGRREILIQYLQNIGYEKLLNSPAELAINYINAGCPLIERNYERHSSQPFSRVWADIASNPDKTFIFDKQQIRDGGEMTRKGFDFAAQLTDHPGITQVIVDPVTGSRLALEDVLKLLNGIGYRKLSDEKKKQFKLSIMLMAIVLCYAPGIADPTVDEFWKWKNVNSTTDKVIYLISNHESLIHRGPFAVMSTMALQQLKKDGKWTRGIYWDILHSVYLLYTDMFLTTDNHFKVLRDQNDFEAYKRVVYLPEAGLFNAKDIDLI